MSFRGELTSQRIDQLARQSGIDVPRMRRGMDSPEVTRLLEDNRAMAIDMGNSATPLLIINGEQVSGFDQARLDARLREAAREVREARR
jgi:2-hydroxychromene-2-carboxylate isomerase